MKTKRKRKVNWVNHSVGFISVVLGVIIAFWLNNWNEQRKEKKSIQVALQNIKSEMIRNQASLDTIINQNARQADFLSKYLESVDEDMNIIVPTEEWGKLVAEYPDQLELQSSGVRLNMDLYQLSEVAWATTNRTGILSSVSFDLAYTLESTYDLQEKVNEFDQSFLSDLRAITGKKTPFNRVYRSLTISLDLAHQLKDIDYPKALKAVEETIKD